MTPELDKKLVEKYPLIFRDRYEDPSKTCMYWGFECGDGWYNIIDVMCAQIQHHIEWRQEQIEHTIKWNANVNDPDYEWIAFVPREERKVPEEIEQVVAIQVKEKFGGLRFYYYGGDDYIRGVVDLAESLSYKTCEICGAPGKSNDEGWVTTRCKNHEDPIKEV